MDMYTIAEEAYKNGYAKGYADGVAARKEIETKIKYLENIIAIGTKEEAFNDLKIALIKGDDNV